LQSALEKFAEDRFSILDKNATSVVIAPLW